MVSEDSDQLMPGLLSIHRLRNLCDVRQTRVGQMYTAIDQRNAAGELLQIPLLRGTQRVLLEERNDRADQVAPPPHHVTIQVLLVVVVSPIGDDASHTEEALELA